MKRPEVGQCDGCGLENVVVVDFAASRRKDAEYVSWPLIALCGDCAPTFLDAIEPFVGAEAAASMRRPEAVPA